MWDNVASIFIDADLRRTYATWNDPNSRDSCVRDELLWWNAAARSRLSQSQWYYFTNVSPAHVYMEILSPLVPHVSVPILIKVLYNFKGFCIHLVLLEKEVHPLCLTVQDYLRVLKNPRAFDINFSTIISNKQFQIKKFLSRNNFLIIFF